MTSSRRLVFLGGNGHCASRVTAARAAAERLGLALDEAPYPGFEGRPRAHDLEAFLDVIEGWFPSAALVYATGIGGLLALCLRARGRFQGTPLLLQAPVLWGLERRLMPRLMRVGLVRRVARNVFAMRAFQGRFARRHFTRPLLLGEREAFFAGYAACAALPDLFAWLTPALLRRLEATFSRDANAVADVRVWWGGKDGVVTLAELWWTEQALGVSWPARVFPEWGHYPMIDAPEAWAEAVAAHMERD